MNSKTIIAIVVIALIVLGGYFLWSSKAAAPSTTEEQNIETPAANENTTPETNPSVTSVSYTDSGFSPSDISIKVGDTVRFVNNSGSGMWVASDEHPTHTEYDGTATRDHCANGIATNGTFDMCHQGSASESWDYTFTKAGTFDFHNHARASHGGTVTVTE